MKLSAVVTVVAILGVSAWADDAASAKDRTVSVCMEAGADLQVVNSAQKVASQMFAAIGVKIAWHPWPNSCPRGDVIVISLSYHTPKEQRPGAWAYALPYEGTHIQIFYDRVQRTMPSAKTHILLAHVVVHEITHILEAIQRHSETGVMKAQWDAQDYFEMGRKPLAFTKHDVDLIYDGLDARKARLAGAH